MLNFPDEDEEGSITDGEGPMLSDVRALRPSPLPSQARRIELPQRPSDDLDLRQLWLKVRGSYPIVLLVAGAVFLAVMLITLASKTQFQATGRLYLGELDGRAGVTGASAGDFDISGAVHGELGSEIEILRSRTLVVQAIQAAGLNVSIAPAGEPPSRYWRWLLSRRDPSSLDRAARELRAIDATLSERFREEQRYLVRFTTNDEYEIWADAGQIGSGKLAQPFAAPDLKLTLLRGPSGQPQAGSQYDLRISPLDRVTERALEHLQVTTPKGGSAVNVVTLQYTETSPHMAAAFLEQLMLAYLKERQTWKTEDASAAEAFVGNQLSSIRASLDEVQQKLADYRQNNRVVVLDNEAKAMIERIAKYEEQRLNARMQVAAMADIQRSLKGANPPIGAFLLGEANDPVLESMANSLSSARQKLTTLDARFSGAAPDMREQQAQVDAQLAAIRSYVGSRLTRAQESLGALNSIIGQFEEKLKTVPGAELGLAQLNRESEVYSKTYSYLLERQQQAAIIKASQLSKNRVLDLPQVPSREYSPKLLLRLLLGFAGLLLGIAWVVVRGLFSSTLQSEADVQRAVGSHPLIGSIPRQRESNGFGVTPKWFHVFDRPAADVGSRFLEAFRALRTNLYRWGSAAGQRGRVVLFTSPNPGDGKTTCANWLAAALAADGRRVLLIDADLRKSLRHSGDEELAEPGLRAVLTGEYIWHEVAFRVSEPAQGFCNLPSGGTASPELLSSQRMIDLVNEAKERFDFILIDAPSFPIYSDALVLASISDIVLSVLRLRTTLRKAASEHVIQLAASASSFAVIANNAGGAAAPKFVYPGQRGGSGATELRGSAAVRRARRAFWLAAALAIALAGAVWLTRQGIVS
ncbi:MAG TPA: GNVR domain-containing protein [Polyangiaceae bacterium]|nr:GNVR domain-containing protein [Polyangiaceae bacterium]